MKFEISIKIMNSDAICAILEFNLVLYPKSLIVKFLINNFLNSRLCLLLTIITWCKNVKFWGRRILINRWHLLLDFEKLVEIGAIGMVLSHLKVISFFEFWSMFSSTGNELLNLFPSLLPCKPKTKFWEFRVKKNFFFERKFSENHELWAKI